MSSIDPLTAVARARYALKLARTHGDLNVARAAIMAGNFDLELDLPAAKLALNQIVDLYVDDMPPPVACVQTLLEVAAQRYGECSHGEVWMSIGVSQKRGVHLLGSAGHKSFDWPTYFTLRELAFGKDQ